MKWTTGAVIGTRFLERHVTFDDIDDIYAVEQILNERLGNHLWGMKPIETQTSAGRLV